MGRCNITTTNLEAETVAWPPWSLHASQLIVKDESSNTIVWADRSRLPRGYWVIIHNRSEEEYV